MDPRKLSEYERQIVELTFGDGLRLRAHLIKVDVHEIQNQVWYDLLEVLHAGSSGRPGLTKRTGWVSDAEDIVEVAGTDGVRYQIAPGSRVFGRRHWWRFW